jgi:hypothetical protein
MRRALPWFLPQHVFMKIFCRDSAGCRGGVLSPAVAASLSFLLLRQRFMLFSAVRFAVIVYLCRDTVSGRFPAAVRVAISVFFSFLFQHRVNITYLLHILEDLAKAFQRHCVGTFPIGD